MSSELVTLELANVAFLGSSAEPLSLSSSGRRLGLVGDWEPLFRAFLEPRAITQGKARVIGLEPSAALGSGRVGLALCDPALPVEFSVREYLEQAARLAHGSASKGSSEAQRSLDRF